NMLKSIINGCAKIENIPQKLATIDDDDYKIKKDEILINNKQQNLSQFQLITTTTTTTTTNANANFSLFVTVRSPNNEKELPNISVTEAYQPFSITRYTAHSKIDFRKQFHKLNNYNKTKPLIRTHQLINPMKSDSTSSPYLTKNTSQFEFNNNSNALILSFASPIASKQSITTPISFLFLKTTISNAITNTSIPITTTTITTTTTIITSTNTITSTTTITTTTTTRISSTSKSLQSILGFEKIKKHNLDAMPPLIPLKPNFFGNNFDGIFVPWFNKPKFTLWPERLLRRG
ncbi:hypothetical protein WUBG_12688, partial [Wuchereria bancrofti]